MNNHESIDPVLKWAGGKRQLLDKLIPLMPDNIQRYCEPFVGGGAVLLSIQPQTAYINDINHELILLYTVIKEHVEELISLLSEYKNEADFFYEIRNLDRDKEKYNTLTNLQKAARFLYLNRTCYNGLYRVNRSGEFNTPFGRYKNPNIVNADGLRKLSQYFNQANISFSSVDCADILKQIPDDTFVYLDPPYDPVSETASFTGYSKNGFSKEDQIRLRECCDELNTRGIKFMLSNSATEFIYEQYQNYQISVVQAKRYINANSNGRGQVDELIIRNYQN